MEATESPTEAVSLDGLPSLPLLYILRSLQNDLLLVHLRVGSTPHSPCRRLPAAAQAEQRLSIDHRDALAPLLPPPLPHPPLP